MRERRLQIEEEHHLRDRERDHREVDALPPNRKRPDQRVDRHHAVLRTAALDLMHEAFDVIERPQQPVGVRRLAPRDAPRELDEAQDHGQRGTEVVVRHREELATAAFELAQVRDVVEDHDRRGHSALAIPEWRGVHQEHLAVAVGRPEPQPLPANGLAAQRA